MEAAGLTVSRQGLTYVVSRSSDPPPLLVPLDWRLTAAGVLGDSQSLRDQWRSWPAVRAITGPAGAEEALRHLEGLARPASVFQLAEALHAAEGIVLAAPDADALVRNASRVGPKLLEWYPAGQMTAWGTNYRYLVAGRAGHLLAAASAGGWGSLQRALRDGRRGLWSIGEDISTAQPAGLYLNLINHLNVIGVALNTLPVSFIFEFGISLLDEHPLDFLGVRYVHSVADVHYLSPGAARSRTGPGPGLLQQDALREWFVRRFNALADHLVRLENFRARTGEIRPLAMQQTSMTVNRILNVTAHLLASGETAARFSDVWDLVDLYGTLAGGVDKLFASAYWNSKIMPGVAALPGSLAGLFTGYARALRDEFVAEIAEGITDPRRRSSKSVRVDSAGGPQRMSHEAFLAQYMAVRRNTLHGYDLRRADQRQFLAIHDGRLPVRLPEWGRLQAVALLAGPAAFIERRFLPP
jgi:hypothetical protein